MPSLTAQLAEFITLKADEPGAKWHLLFPRDTVRYRADFPNGIKFDLSALKSFAENYTREGKPERAVNYFHLGGSGVAAPSIDQKVAAGWIVDLRLADAGLEAAIKWTDRAKKYILADELRYLSPEFRMSMLDKRTGIDQGPTLLGAALLNDPFLTDLPRVAADEGVAKMKCEKCGADPMKCADCEAKKMGETLESLKQENEALKTKLTEAEKATVKLTESEGALVKLNERVAFLEAEKLSTEVRLFVDSLVRAGKVTPAIRESVEKLGMSGGVAAIKFFEKATPVVVPGQELGVPGEVGGDPKTDAKKRFEARVAALQKDGMKYLTAFDQTKAEMPKEFSLYFSA